MKEKKESCIGLLIMLFYISIMQLQTVNAEVSPFLSVSANKAVVEKDSYVNVSVDLNGNPSISTLGAVLSYDNSILSYDSAVWSKGFSGSDIKMASDTGSEVNLSVVCDSSYSTDGTVVTVRFHAVSDSSFLPVTLSLRDMADADLNAVTDCTVSSQVRVSEASKTSKRKQRKGDAEDVERSSVQQAVNVSSTDTENVQTTSNTVEVDTSKSTELADSGVQSTSVQEVQSVSKLVTKNVQPDQNYKTGVGLGDDIFLILAASCGVLALVLAVRKYGEEKK